MPLLFQANKPAWPYQLNKDSDLAQGLLLWGSGDPSGGATLADLGGRSFNGTIEGTVPSLGFWAPGNGGGKGSLRLDGSTNDVNFGTASVLNPLAVTMSIWVN